MKNVILTFSAAILLLSCKDTKNETLVMEDKQETIDSMNVVMEKQKMELAKQKSIDSMQAIAGRQQARSSRVTSNAVAATPAAEQKRKGWSGAAKGAVIGAGVGAVGGALIDKKKPAQGAIIGGLAGAGLGAGTGAIIDSEKKRKQGQ